MDKLTSLIIIIIIVYISYDYCSQPIIEGQAGPNKGDYSKDEDNVATEVVCNKPAKIVIDDAANLDKCQFKGVSCIDAMANGDARDKWVYGDKGNDNPYKTNCMKCVQGSDQDSTARRYLAGIGYEKDTREHNSYFARQLCDAMAAECDSSIWYANAHSDWASQDCKNLPANVSKSTTAMCLVLGSSVLQFFMSFLGGVTCLLDIKAKELYSMTIKPITDALDHIPGVNI